MLIIAELKENVYRITEIEEFIRTDNFETPHLAVDNYQNISKLFNTLGEYIKRKEKSINDLEEYLRQEIQDIEITSSERETPEKQSIR